MKSRSPVARLGFFGFRIFMFAVSGAIATVTYAAPLTVTSFSPSGVTREVRQVQAVFSEPVVPFAEGGQAVEPFRVACSASGKARWLDERTWLYEFPSDLSSGISCRFTMRADLVALSGATPSEETEFSFSTGGPAIVSANPYEGGEVEEEPYFRIITTGPYDSRSIEEHVTFVNAGIESPIGVTVVTGSIADEIWKSEYDITPTERRLVIKPRLRFAPATKVKLIWGSGVKAPSGEELGTPQVLEYSVRGPLSATVSCPRVNVNAGCIPLRPIILSFSSPIPVELAKQVRLKDPAGKTWGIALDDGYNNNLYGYVEFKGPFTESTELTVEFPSGFQDDIGRPLEMGGPITVRIDSYPPLAKFSADFGIIERGEQQLLPITVRNIEPAIAVELERAGRPLGATLPAKMTRISSVENILTWFERFRITERGQSVFASTPAVKVERFEVPRSPSGNEMEVIGIPLKDPGFYAVEVESPALGRAYLDGGKSYYVRTIALVTDLAVHVKKGAERSLVWVTSLGSGAPVEGANVVVADCRGKALASGRTDKNGTFTTESIPESLSYEYCGSRPAQFVVLAQKGEDYSVTLSSWDEGIEVWRFGLPTGVWRDTFESAHTVLAQSLVRRGDTVKMKHILRRRTGGGLRFPNREFPTIVRMTHLGNYERFEVPLTWRKNGSAENEWKVPPGAKLGSYSIELIRKRKDEEDALSSGVLRVEDFRVPLMRGIASFPGKNLVAPTSVPLTTSVSYLAGGGAAKLPVTVRYKVNPAWYFPRLGIDSYALANGSVKTGLQRNDGSSEEAPVRSGLSTKSVVLDDTGSASVALDGLDLQGLPSTIFAELEYKDVAGFVQTVSASASVWPTDVLVAIKTGNWMAKDSVPVQVVAISPTGERKVGVPVSIDMFRRTTLSNRKRIVGGFYAYESSAETEKIGSVCSGVTDTEGEFRCTVSLPTSGEFLLESRVVDSAGRASVAHTSVWGNAEDRHWFGGRDDDRIDVLPEKQEYAADETARLQVRMPFNAATALVSVEREGVIESFVQQIDSRDPVVSVPMKAAYAPNVYVSVLVVRGRIGEHEPTAMLDLGKPAFKFGVAAVKVGWQPHEIAVAVTPEREVYRVREKARVRIQATGASDGKPIAHGEVALVALDEGILELQPNDSWKLLAGMMGTRPYNVSTWTSQMHVVGRRHFGLKARPDGGGGGKGSTRELFDALLYWNPRVPLDKNGEATIEIPLNDSLTSFRIAAVTTSGESRFGTGSASVRATQDLIVIPGFAPVVRHGDSVRGTVSLRNTTDQPMPVELSLVTDDERVSGAAESRTVEPNGSAEVTWRLAIPEGIEGLTYTLIARSGEKILDRITVKQRVVAPAVERVYDSTIRQASPMVTVPVTLPKDAIPGKGGLVVALSARLGDGLRGVIEEMRRYPYTCLEQRISKAVALSEAALWADTMAILPTYIDDGGLLKYFVTEMRGSEILTAYVLGIAAARGWEIPASERGKMIGALQGFVGGMASGPDRSSAGQGAKLFALEALSRAGENVGALAQDLVIDPSLLSTSNLINWYLILHRTVDLPDRAARLDAARSNLRARLNLSGTELGFSTEKVDREWWLMSSVDVNAVRLLDALIETGDWSGEVPRVAQGAIARQREGRWDLTVANAWGSVALPRFSAKYEKTPVRGESAISLGGLERSVRWGAKADPEPVMMPWSEGIGDLTVQQRGSGSPWVTIQSRAVIPVRESLSRGYTVRKSYEPVVQRVPGKWSSGDIVRVKLEVDAQAERNWVVIDDPIPPGAAIIGGQSLSKSLVADTTSAAAEISDENLYPTFEERTFEAYRGYFDSMMKGTGRVQYTMRLNTAGEFVLPETRVEALYSPDMFGALPNTSFVVEP